MRRTVSAWIIGAAVLGLAQPAFAVVYVPGQHRDDGIYIRPHFQSSKTRLDEAWFEELANPLATNKNGKLPPGENGPGKGDAAPETGP